MYNIIRTDTNRSCLHVKVDFSRSVGTFARTGCDVHLEENDREDCVYDVKYVLPVERGRSKTTAEKNRGRDAVT